MASALFAAEIAGFLGFSGLDALKAFVAASRAFFAQPPNGLLTNDDSVHGDSVPDGSMTATVRVASWNLATAPSRFHTCAALRLMSGRRGIAVAPRRAQTTEPPGSSGRSTSSSRGPPSNRSAQTPGSAFPPLPAMAGRRRGLSLRRISVVAVGATLIGDLREPQVDVERELWRLSGSQMATQVLLAGLLDGLYALGEEGRGIVLNAFAYAESAASIGSLDLGAEQPLDHLQALLGALEDLRKATIGSNPGFAEKQP